jgi:hypothetical protein
MAIIACMHGLGVGAVGFFSLTLDFVVKAEHDIFVAASALVLSA